MSTGLERPTVESTKEVTATSAIVPMIQTTRRTKRSLYGAHNLIIVSGKTTFGLFFDYPSELTFDIGYTRMDTLKVTCADADLNVYVIGGESAYDIVKQFRQCDRT